jgi:hypothetical protein
MPIPLNVHEFEEKFKTEEDCQEALAKLRWPDGFVCPNCGHDDGQKLQNRPLIQCRLCRHQASVTAGTMFHKTRVPLKNWFWMIHSMAVSKGGVSTMRLSVQLGMYYKTAWHIMQKIRHAMASRDDGITLAGLIEVDEAIVGPEARKTGRMKKEKEGQFEAKPRGKYRGRKPRSGAKRKIQTEVLVLVEREAHGAGSLAMRVLERTNRDNISEVVEHRVEPNQHFKTDALQSHFVLRKFGQHTAINQSTWTGGEDALPVVHRAISLLKRSLMGTHHGVGQRYLQRYLHEMAFRWNRKDSLHTIVQSLLRACVFTVPMTYAELRL